MSDLCQDSDVIFVLAGRECRKHFALRLWQADSVPALLLSVGRFEIRRFSTLELPVAIDLLAIASATEPRCRHYFVKIGAETAEAQQIAIGRFGTWSEIAAFSDWLQKHPSIRSATVVSSGFHLRRVRMCCRQHAPESVRLSFLAAPDDGHFSRGGWWLDSNSRKLVLSEVLKLAIYKLLCLGLMMRECASVLASHKKKPSTMECA